MAIEKRPLEDIRSVARRNREFAWPHRAKSNRLEPICRPRFDASFTLNAGDKVFTVGSCFASNIRTHLEFAGLAVHPADIKNDIPAAYRVNNIDFRYSPMTILQGFQWALEPDSLPPRAACHIQTGEGRVFDPTIDHQTDGPVAEVQGIAAKITAADGAVAECRAVIMTLGLMESVFDARTGLYLEAWPGDRVPAADRDRYQLHVLGADDAVAALEAIHALLSRNLAENFKILLTVSPVPLASTFRYLDVISANAYSKSALRTAAEEFAAAHDNVDYLPVYESVMLTNSTIAWDVDLRHPSDFIVKLNVMRMLQAYFPDAPGFDETAIEAEIENQQAAFEAGWPQQLRAFKHEFGQQEQQFNDYREKSEALRAAMEAEIVRLRQQIEQLEKD